MYCIFEVSLKLPKNMAVDDLLVIPHIVNLLPSYLQLTSSKSQYVLYPKLLGSMQVSSHVIFGGIGTSDVQHCLKAAEVEGSIGNGHRTGLLVTTGVSSNVPRHVTEKRTSCRHSLESAD